MPELPEVETISRGLSRILPGKKILAASVLRPDSIGFPAAGQFARAVRGRTFLAVRRRGKYLLFDLDGDAGLIVHLRMSGRLIFAGRRALDGMQALDGRRAAAAGQSPASAHVRVRLSLSNGYELLFEDMRAFGRIWYKPPARSFEQIVPALANLGPEPLSAELSASYLAKIFRKRLLPVKSALLDQKLIAGIGNIYADESLHICHINPLTQAGLLSETALSNLVAGIQEILRKAITLGGSTLRNYTDESGGRGNYQEQSLVYGRKGQPCRTCRSEIVKIRLGGRSTHFCPGCQPPISKSPAKPSSRHV